MMIKRDQCFPLDASVEFRILFWSISIYYGLNIDQLFQRIY